MEQLFANDIHQMMQNDGYLDMILAQERKRRIEFEGPIAGDLVIITEITGTKYKIRRGGKPWSRQEPCVQCSDEDCLQHLLELSEVTPRRYIYGDLVSITNNPSNMGLLRMLCQWRKHVSETCIIKQPPGSEKWKRYSICTSELTFLGRTTANGGIIGIVSLTEKPISSLGSLVSLMNKEDGIHNGVKGLSIGFALLIAMYMDWDLYTEENRAITDRLLKKVRKNRLVGLDTYCGSPWYSMFTHILERTRIHDKLKEMILSRAHLP